MSPIPNLSVVLILLFTGVLFLNTVGQKKVLVDSATEHTRTSAYELQLENYLKNYIIDGYKTRAAEAWHRDYSNPDALKRSVEPNRRKWETVIKPPLLSKSGPMKKRPYSMGDIKAEWLELPLGAISAEAILAFPEGTTPGKPVPLIITQHGIGSNPESPFEIGQKPGYNGYAAALLKAGFAVLSPLNLRNVDRRNHIERYARVADLSLPGIELVRLQHMLDVVLADSRIDAGRVGMWGVSLGGMATMFWMPLEPRIKVGIVSAWYNNRLPKMILPDDNYVSFMVTDEDHAFFTGWLTEFSDDDVVSMICPRPLMIQHGKKDRIADWPKMVEEFKRGKIHYDKLNIGDRMELVLHDGGHEAIAAEGVRFLSKWLNVHL